VRKEARKEVRVDGAAADAVKGKVKGAEETMKGMEETMEGTEETMEGTESSMERTRRGKPRSVARRGAGGWAQGAWRAWASERGR
jgi:hypothetical protein